MKPATVMLLGLFAVGIYLLYRSLQNVSGSVSNLQGQISGYITGVESIPSTAYSTGKAELSSLSSSLLSPVLSLGTLGTNAYNSFFGSGSTTVSSGLGDLSGITGPSLLLPDGSSATLSSDLNTSGVLLPDGGSLSFDGLSPILGGGLTAVNSDGSYGSLTDSSPGDGFLPTTDGSTDWSSPDFFGDL